MSSSGGHRNNKDCAIARLAKFEAAYGANPKYAAVIRRARDLIDSYRYGWAIGLLASSDGALSGKVDDVGVDAHGAFLIAAFRYIEATYDFGAAVSRIEHRGGFRAAGCGDLASFMAKYGYESEDVKFLRKLGESLPSPDYVSPRGLREALALIAKRDMRLIELAAQTRPRKTRGGGALDRVESRGFETAVKNKKKRGKGNGPSGAA